MAVAVVVAVAVAVKAEAAAAVQAYVIEKELIDRSSPMNDI